MARRFSATQQSTVRDLQRVMGKIGATSLRLEQDVIGGGVKVIFDRAGKRYVRECVKWADSMRLVCRLNTYIVHLKSMVSI